MRMFFNVYSFHRNGPNSMSFFFSLVSVFVVLFMVYSLIRFDPVMKSLKAYLLLRI